MKPVAVLYATREGLAKEVAAQVAAGLHARGLDATVLDARDAGGFDASAFCAAVLAASVHAGTHEREMVELARAQREALASMPNAFLSITLSEAGAERKDATPEQHARFVADVRGMIDRFVADTGWRPEHVVPVAGALRYTQYNFLVRLVMKRIARASGGSADTSRDHEYTDWTALDDFVALFADEIKRRADGDEGSAENTPSA